MNKKLFTMLFIVFSLVAQPACAWFGWMRSIKHGVSDIYYVIKPEWSTAERKKYVHDGIRYQRACFGGKKPANDKTLKQNDETLLPYINGSDKDESDKKLKAEKDRLGKLPQDKTGRIFSVDDDGTKTELSETGKRVKTSGKEEKKEFCAQAIPEDELVSERKAQDDESTITIKWRSYYIDRIDTISHEDQTKEKLQKIHFLKSLYAFKRNTNLFGCYIFMKPYALASVAGLSFGAYKLAKKLGIYEKFLEPNTQGLEADELDGESFALKA